MIRPIVSPTSISAREVFAIPDFRRTWAIGSLTAVSRWLEIVGSAIFTYEVTQSPQLVAMIAVMRMLPYVALGLLLGSLADSFERKAMLLLALASMLMTCLAMAALTGLGIEGYGAILAATFVSGIFWTIDMPVRRRLMVDVIGTERMSAGLGIDNASMHAARMVGPMVAGLIYEVAGIAGIFLCVAALYTVCIMLAAGLSTSASPRSGSRLNLSSLLPPRELFRDRRFQIVMGVTIVYNLWCFPFTNMIPVIAQNDFALAPRWVGIVTAIDGVGGILGALLVAVVVKDRTLFYFYFAGTLGVVLLFGVLSLHLTVTAAIPALLLIGAASACFSATQYALVYTLSPPELRGRATGVLQFFIGSSMVGHWMTGLLFERLGSALAMQVMAVQAILCLGILGTLWFRLQRDGR